MLFSLFLVHPHHINYHFCFFSSPCAPFTPIPNKYFWFSSISSKLIQIPSPHPPSPLLPPLLSVSLSYSTYFSLHACLCRRFYWQNASGGCEAIASCVVLGKSCSTLLPTSTGQCLHVQFHPPWIMSLYHHPYTEIMEVRKEKLLVFWWHLTLSGLFLSVFLFLHDMLKGIVFYFHFLILHCQCKEMLHVSVCASFVLLACCIYLSVLVVFMWSLLGFLYIVSCHLHIMTILPLPFQYEYILFLFLVWLLWLGLPILCLIEAMKVGILVLFQILAERILAFHHWVLCWLWLCHK